MRDDALAMDADTPGQLRLAGDWVLAEAGRLEPLVQRAPRGVERIDATALDRLDSAGALLLMHLLERLGLDFDRLALRGDHQPLVAAVHRACAHAPPHPPPPGGFLSLLERVGRAVTNIGAKARALLGFLGLTLSTLAGVMVRPRRLRLTSTVHHMEQTGLDAVPLVLLLSFLVGAVIAFLGIMVLRDFGAEIYVVELVSFAFLREFGVLLTAILLAGRTASAFTAQIGAMKAREEIDAIRVLGLDPIELLVIPRLLALLIMLPLLGFLAGIAGIAGGMAIAYVEMDMAPIAFLSLLEETIEVRHLLTGLAKTPVFAFIIAMIGCLEGFKVGGTAQSVGERTTSSVVQSISLVILVDAIAAVFFMEMGW